MISNKQTKSVKFVGVTNFQSLIAGNITMTGASFKPVQNANQYNSQMLICSCGSGVQVRVDMNVSSRSASLCSAAKVRAAELAQLTMALNPLEEGCLSSGSLGWWTEASTSEGSKA